MAAGKALGAIVVGTGFGVLTHLRALRAAGFEVHALVGRDPARTEDRAKRSGVALGTTSLERALALSGVDVVSIATPPHTHAGIALAAARAGKHVMCEKPFARDAAEARRMLEAVEKANVVHLMGFEFRFSTGQALATRAIRAGAIGEPRLATFALQIPGLAEPAAGVPGWWSDAEQGGGWLGAFASHVVDEIRAMFGELEGVSASLSSVVERAWSAEDSFTVHFRTRSGVAGVMQSSGAVYGPPLGMTRIAGTRGTLWLEGDDVYVADATGQRKLQVPSDLLNPAPLPPDRAFLHSHYDWLHSGGIDLGPFTKLFGVLRDRIRGLPDSGDPRAASFADGLASQVALDAIRRSARERAWVPIEPG
jgi:predicted dehydrogenase